MQRQAAGTCESSGPLSTFALEGEHEMLRLEKRLSWMCDQTGRAAKTTPRIQIPAPSELGRFIDHVPALGWSALPDGSLDYVNQRFRDYTGLSPDELYGSGWKSAVHRDDIQALESWSRETRQS